MVGKPTSSQSVETEPEDFADKVKKNVMKLDNLEMFVLDECDKMLDESDMREQVQKIFMRGNASR